MNANSKRPHTLDATGAERTRASGGAPTSSSCGRSHASTVELTSAPAPSITDPTGSAATSEPKTRMRRSKSPGGLAEPGFVQQAS